MPAGPDATQVTQRRDNPDGAVTAHPQVAYVIEKDDSGGAVRPAGLAEKGSNQSIGTAGFVDDRGAKGIETLAKAKQSFSHGTGAECGSSLHHDPGRFTGRMGVDDADAFH